MKKSTSFLLYLIAVILIAASEVLAARAPGIADSDLVPDPSPQAIKHEIIRTYGPARLMRVGEQKVLYLQGTHREMGFQHGKILAAELENPAMLAEAFIHYAGKKGRPEADLKKRAAIEKPFIPHYIREEMAGLAEGAGIPLELSLIHI